MLAPLRAVNDQRFHGFLMFSSSYSRLAEFCSEMSRNFERDAGQKMFISILGQQTCEGLKISVNSIIEATQILL